MNSDQISPNEETRLAWDANAKVWDERMGDEGNEMFQILQWPAVSDLLGLSTWQSAEKSPQVLDIACGNGLTSRKLALAGAQVTAFDFSKELIGKALQRSNPGGRISYKMIDGTDEDALISLGGKTFDAALSNMALFDMADIDPLFKCLALLLKPGGVFVFSLTHPAFNNASSVHMAEEQDVEGRITTTYSIKVSRYMTPWQAHGVALRNQPKAQIYFERPIQYYLNLGFKHGFVLDGFAERAYPPAPAREKPLSWGGQFSEIPPVLVMRMRLP